MAQVPVTREEKMGHLGSGCQRSERVHGPDPRPRGPPGWRPGGRCERMRPLSYTSASKRTPDRRDPDDRIPPNTRQIHGSHTRIQQTVMFELQFVQIMTVTRARRGSAGGSVQIAGDSRAPLCLHVSATAESAAHPLPYTTPCAWPSSQFGSQMRTVET